MEMLWVVLGLVVLVVAIVAYVLMNRARRAKRKEQVKEIEYLLDRVSEAAKKRKAQLYESLDAKENAALSALKDLAGTAPVDISAEVLQIEARWARLSEQLVEFSNQSVQATLQSSVVTTRAAMTADDITQLVTSAKAKLSKI
jgi:type II secretory pathway pseudopilin PulG